MFSKHSSALRNLIMALSTRIGEISNVWGFELSIHCLFKAFDFENINTSLHIYITLL